MSRRDNIQPSNAMQSVTDGKELERRRHREREARNRGPGYAIWGGFKMDRNTGATAVAGQMIPIPLVIGFDEIQVLPVER